MKKVRKYNEFIDNAKLIKFEELTSIVEEECSVVSSNNTIINHPQYQEIIKMGKKIVPLLLKRLDESSMWLDALFIITGEDPVDKSHCGKIQLMKEDWKNWGIKNGIK